MALNWTSQVIAEVLGGQHHGEAVPVDGMIHDTRLLSKGNLFLALKGANSDGHEHLAQARAAGASAALVARAIDDPLPQIEVSDVLIAAGELAAAWRASLDVQVVGITGSNGKTSVKEMVSAILSHAGKTLATDGNYNNEIGVPITLSRLDATHQYAVVEMGAARQGDIRYLSHLVKPNVGILTNAGPAHLESFGSIETIVQTKGELFAALSDDGTAIINADSPYLRHWRDLAAHCHSLHFALKHDAEFQADVPVDYQMGDAIAITTPEGEFEMTLPLPGRHNMMNALASMAAAHRLGIGVEQSLHALKELSAVSQRLQIHRPDRDCVIVDDSYNANPASTQASIEVLSGFPGESWLVLGDMLELGDQAHQMHRDIGQQAKQAGIDRLLGYGPLAQHAVDGFGSDGEWFEDQVSLIEALRLDRPTQVAILVKGSRSMRMDRVVAALLGGAA